MQDGKGNIEPSSTEINIFSTAQDRKIVIIFFTKRIKELQLDQRTKTKELELFRLG